MTKLAVLLTLLISQTAYGDAINDASQRLCDKMKTCIYQQMDVEENVTPQMKQMVENMVVGMCTNMMDTSSILGKQDLVEPAVACLDSMSQKSCSELENNTETPECVEFEKLTGQYGDS